MYMKRAVVIGASSGIGREAARLLLADGWHVGVAARRIELLSGLEDEFPGRVVVSRIDVTADDARVCQNTPNSKKLTKP